MSINFQKLNFEVMSDTQKCYETIPSLIDSVKESIKRQFMVEETEVVRVPASNQVTTEYVVSGKRSFEAAKAYAGKRVAVLNFANNHSIGGAPFYAGAQEESLCRCSTLLPCLKAMETPFYKKHIDMYNARKMDFMGNDDLIYTPDVVVFKSDKRTVPVHPEMLEESEWFKVNIITCAAPQLTHSQTRPDNYETVVSGRVKKILDVAASEKNEVIILGAWGCGAFCNPMEIVAKTFVEQLKNYNFRVVEFALATTEDISDNIFNRVLNLYSTSTDFCR